MGELVSYNVEPVGRTERQLSGIDATVRLVTGKLLNIDTKVDTYPTARLPIEVFNVYTNGQPDRHGWALREDYLTDYVIFYRPAHNTGYVLPHKKLFTFVAGNYNELKHLAQTKQKGFFLSSADNGKYHTKNICIPVEVLKAELGADIEVWLY